MIYTDRTKLAMNLAYKAHHGQFDKSGVPYIYHPIFVASCMTDELSVIVALLHDTVEDTSLSFADIRNAGFSDDVIEPLKLLTRDFNMSYMDYIRNLKGNDIARRVKIADLQHNSDLRRLSLATPDDVSRCKKI